MISGPVSAVIPVHDRLDLLARHSLRSVLTQAGVDIEAIVVCDGSPESVITYLDGLKEPRLRIVRHERPRGVARARNAGLAAATGEWVAFIDDDDIWAPTKLADLVSHAEARRAGFAYSGAVIISEDYRVRSYTPAPTPDGLVRALLRENLMPGGGSNVLAKRELLDSIGGYDEGLRYMSDWDMAIRLAQASSGASIDAPLTAWFRHPGATAPSAVDVFRDLGLLRQKHANVLAREGIEIDRAPVYYYVANSELDVGGRGHRIRSARMFARSAWVSRDPRTLVHVGRALLGSRINTALRERLRRRPRRPSWLDTYIDADRGPVVSDDLRSRAWTASGS